MPLDDQIAQRRANFQAICDLGVAPYPNAFDATASVSELVERHGASAAEALEALAARLRDASRTVDATAFDAATDLLCDGSGPLYQWAEPATLRRRARVICEDL